MVGHVLIRSVVLRELVAPRLRERVERSVTNERPIAIQLAHAIEITEHVVARLVVVHVRFGRVGGGGRGRDAQAPVLPVVVAIGRHVHAHRRWAHGSVIAGVLLGGGLGHLHGTRGRREGQRFSQLGAVARGVGGRTAPDAGARDSDGAEKTAAHGSIIAADLRTRTPASFAQSPRAMGAALQTNALNPVTERPTIRLLICSVPSYE